MGESSVKNTQSFSRIGAPPSALEATDFCEPLSALEAAAFGELPSALGAVAFGELPPALEAGPPPVGAPNARAALELGPQGGTGALEEEGLVEEDAGTVLGTEAVAPAGAAVGGQP